MEKYIKPEVLDAEVELSLFVCVSIGEMNNLVEVDEYENIEEEGLNFDSDY